MASSTPATGVTPVKKTIVFSPADIKKIGLDKLIKVQLPAAKTDANAEAKSDTETPADHVDAVEAVEPVEEATDAKDEEAPVSPKSKNTFCTNLKMKMAQVLQDKKITIVAKTKAQELVIIKRPSNTTPGSADSGDGKRIKVVQNKIVQVAGKQDEDALNGKTMKVVVKAKPVIKKKLPALEDDDDEESNPVFKATPMKTYKRKRSDVDESKIEPPKLTKVEETAIVTKVELKLPPALLPKKRGRKSKAELAEIARLSAGKKDISEDVMEIKLIDGEHDVENDDSDAEEIIIVKVPKKDNGDPDHVEEEIHFITDKTAEDSEEDEEASKPKPRKVIDKKTTEELVQAIKKKRGRRSKAELEILARWERMERGVEESEEDDEEQEEGPEEVEEEEEEISMIIMSPTRTGRVPKRNKIFDNYVTTSRGRKQSSDTEYTPKPSPAPKPSDGSTPKRGRGRPPKNRSAETPKAPPAEEKKEEKVTVVQNESAEAVHVTGDDEVIVIPKKRGRTFVQNVEVQEIKDSSKEEEGKEKDDESMVVECEDKDTADSPGETSIDEKPAEETASENPEQTESTAEKKESNTEEETTDKDTENKEEPSEEKETEIAESKVDEETETVKNISIPEEDTEKKTDEKKDESETNKTVEGIEEKPAKADDSDKKADGGDEEESIEDADASDAKADGGDAEVVAVRRRGRQLMHKVNKRTAVKRQLEVVESPSTSGADGVDEPSKKLPKLDTSNEPVADLSVKRSGEGPSTRMYKLLVANLVVRIRQEMAAAQDKPKKPGESITCAICKTNCKPAIWGYHKQRQHNNLAWKTTEKPLDLDNHVLVNSILVKLYFKKVPCFCECGDSKKSALGFLNHKQTCNRSEDEIASLNVACEICNEQMLPSRLVEHDKFHKRQENKEKKKSVPKLRDISDDAPGKRNAAKRASMIITQVSKDLQSYSHCDEIRHKLMRRFYVTHYQQPGIKKKIQEILEEKKEAACIYKCERKFDDISALYEHLQICDEKPCNNKYLLCKICLGIFDIIENFRKHLYESHLELVQKAEEGENFVLGDTKDEEDADEKDLVEMEDSKRTGTPSFGGEVRVFQNAFWRLHKFSTLTRMPFVNTCPKGAHPQIYAHMLKFCEKYYKEDVFQQYPFKKSMWNPLNKNYIMQYLPRMKLSIPVGFTVSKTNSPDTSVRRYKLFESSLDNGTANIYCGGPITAMAWAPTDYTQPECEQFLAVAVQQDTDTVFSFARNDVGCSTIQLWHFGVLVNKAPLKIAPELEVVIAHKHGNIFSMEWCPSGCFEVGGSRLGLLAVCSMDGMVYCYSIGKRKLLSEKIFKPKPIFKLVSTIECDNNLGGKNFYPTKLSWSKAQGHKYIAVGYSNGLVGMFHLQATNDIIKHMDQNNVQMFYPYLTFKADLREITAISLHHLCGGNRYLVTGSGTREMKLWDLHLQSLKPTSLVKRACHHQMFWPVNALSCMGSNDDTSSNIHISVPTTHLVNYDFVRPTTLVFSLAAQRCISGSDWGGVIYLATEGGEVSCSTYRDMYPFMQEVPNRKFMLSGTDVVADENTPIAIKDRNKFKVLQKTHRIIFRDVNMTLLQPLKGAREHQNTNLPDFTKFPLQAATAICNNSNRFSFLFTAVGYNIGFVRVFHSNFLNVNKPV